MNFVVDESGAAAAEIEKSAETIHRSGDNAIYIGDFARSQANNTSHYNKGRFEAGSAIVLFNKNDYGEVAIHEVLHLYGLIDRYTDVYYEKWFLNVRMDGFTPVESVPHVGYEENAMGGGTKKGNEANMLLNDIQFENLATIALNNLSNNTGNVGETITFVFSKDSTQVEAEDSAVPSEVNTGDGTVLKNPVEL